MSVCWSVLVVICVSKDKKGCKCVDFFELFFMCKVLFEYYCVIFAFIDFGSI